jgi:hypothetical protein
MQGVNYDFGLAHARTHTHIHNILRGLNILGKYIYIYNLIIKIVRYENYAVDALKMPVSTYNVETGILILIIKFIKNMSDTQVT